MEIVALTTVVHDRCALVAAVSEKSCVTGRRSKSIVEILRIVRAALRRKYLGSEGCLEYYPVLIHLGTLTSKVSYDCRMISTLWVLRQ